MSNERVISAKVYRLEKSEWMYQITSKHSKLKKRCRGGRKGRVPAPGPLGIMVIV